MDPVITELGRNTRTAVDVTVLVVNLLDQRCNLGIFSLMGTRLTLFPGVIAALGNLQGIAEEGNRILLTLFCNELKFYTRLREKMPIVFLIRRAPAARAHFLVLIGDFLPQVGEDVHFREMHLSRVLQSAGTNG